MLAQKTKPLLAVTANAMLSKVFRRNHFKPPFSFGDKYFGKFDYHDRNKYPRSMASTKEEELLDDIHALKNMEVEEPSPFHVVRRVASIKYLPWNQKITLRRLNLHSSFNGECVIVPNTPQFNALIARVKHLLHLKPAKFPDGRVPTEEDIGAIKVCPYTGIIRIDEKLRMQASRLNTEKPFLFQGHHLRYKIGKLYGFNHNSYIR